MKNINNILKSVFLAAVLVGCSTEDEITDEWVAANTPEPLDVGSVDLSNYVAIGNSLTAGFADGALFPDGQANSFPAILAGQFALAGGGEFNNPNITSGETGTGRISLDIAAALAFLNTGQGSLSDALITGAINPLTENTVTVNNFGVPGARVIDATFAGYGDLNTFFGAFDSGAGSSMLGDAAAAGGTFFTVWLGNNDVLGYATNGGTLDTFDPLDRNTITDSPINPAAPAAPTFTAALSAVLDGLSANGANGIILTIPPVTTIPYFQAATTLGGAPEALLPAGAIDDATAAFLNSAAAYGAYNAGLDNLVLAGAIEQAEADRRKISFTGGAANAPVITDESLTDLSSFGVASWRQASSTNTLGVGDLFPLPALFSLGVTQQDGSVPGVSVPLSDELTLTESEQFNIITATATFNGIIRAQADARANITLVDLDPLFADVNGLSAIQATGLGMSAAGISAADGVVGREVNGINLVPISFEQTTLFNSLFSTDFIHPNPRGGALIVNEIIETMNEVYGSDIPTVNPLIYPGINAPF